MKDWIIRKLGGYTADQHEALQGQYNALEAAHKGISKAYRALLQADKASTGDIQDGVQGLMRTVPCVYIACDEVVAKDIAGKLLWAAKTITDLLKGVMTNDSKRIEGTEQDSIGD